MIKRIVARLDIKNDFLVKGINLEGLRKLGDPSLFSKKYFEEGIDELIFQDVVASLYKRNQLDNLTKKISKNIFIPITVSGGIRTIEDIRRALNNGADRVSINSAAIENIKFLKEAVNVFGSSTISVTIETLKVNNEYLIYSESGRKFTGINLLDWIKKISDENVGEIIITSISHEGRGNGLNIELYNKIDNLTKIPVLAHGGAKDNEDILTLFKETNISGIIIASAFHFYYFNKIQDLSKIENSGSTAFVRNFSFYKKFKTSINELKFFLKNNKIQIR